MKRAKRRPPHKRAEGLRASGDCFTRAGFVMLDLWRRGQHPEKRLAHGKVRDSFHPCRWIDHAWVEIEGAATYRRDDGSEFTEPVTIVIDDTQPDPRARMLPLFVFEQGCEVRDVRRYTFAQMVEQAMRTGHGGPWHEEEAKQ